jgi:hypothetical protein
MDIKVADEVWLATALLHFENPESKDFSSYEIVDRVAKENIFGRLRPGIIVHVNMHCVANKRPNPGNYRILFETGRGRRRLFREGDVFHEYRKGGKIVPNLEDIPEKYRHLLTWYKYVYSKIR